MNYSAITGLSIAGICTLALITAAGNGMQLPVWWEKQNLDWQAEREKARAEHETLVAEIQAKSQNERAQSYRDNGIADFDKLILVSYTACKVIPVRDWGSVVNPQRAVKIYDKSRVFIGTTYQGKFTPTRKFFNPCTGSH